MQWFIEQAEKWTRGECGTDQFKQLIVAAQTGKYADTSMHWNVRMAQAFGATAVSRVFDSAVQLFCAALVPDEANAPVAAELAAEGLGFMAIAEAFESGKENPDVETIAPTARETASREMAKVVLSHRWPENTVSMLCE